MTAHSHTLKTSIFNKTFQTKAQGITLPLRYYYSVKIGFIHPSWPGSEGTGATHTATQLVEQLVVQGHNLTVYCVERPPSDADVQTDVQLKPLPESRIPHTNLALNRSVHKRLDEFGTYDVVASYLTPVIPAMNTISEETTARTVVTLNAYAGICPKNDLRYMGATACEDNGPSRCPPCIAKTSGGSDKHGRMHKITSRLGNYLLVPREPATLSIDGFHALSGHVKETYADFGFSDDRITVIPNPLDESFVVPHKSNFSEPYKLLYVGYLEQHKGIEILPELMRRLTKSGTEFRLTIAGDGGMRSWLKQSVAELDLDDVVDIRGHIPYNDLPSVYAQHDLFVYPGLWEEPFGRVFLEAMSAETPVVATDVGAAAEITGAAGVVSDPTAAALADTILSVVRRDQLRSLSKNTKSELEQYTPEQIGNEMETLYRSLA